MKLTVNLEKTVILSILKITYYPRPEITSERSTTENAL